MEDYVEVLEMYLNRFTVDETTIFINEMEEQIKLDEILSYCKSSEIPLNDILLDFTIRLRSCVYPIAFSINEAKALKKQIVDNLAY